MAWCGLQDLAEVADSLLESTLLDTLYAELKFLEQLRTLGMSLKQVRFLKGRGRRPAGNAQRQDGCETASSEDRSRNAGSRTASNT